MPVAWNIVSLEHFFSELLVATVLDSIDLESMRVDVHIVVLGEKVADRVESGQDEQHRFHHDLLIWGLMPT